MMTVAAIFSLLSFAWVIARIWRASAAMAIAALFFWPVVLYALLRNWGDEDSDIKLPLAVFGLSLCYTLWALEEQRKLGAVL